jgi:hypothetical protein
VTCGVLFFFQGEETKQAHMLQAEFELPALLKSSNLYFFIMWVCKFIFTPHIVGLEKLSIGLLFGGSWLFHVIFMTVHT